MLIFGKLTVVKFTQYENENIPIELTFRNETFVSELQYRNALPPTDRRFGMETVSRRVQFSKDEPIKSTFGNEMDLSE